MQIVVNLQMVVSEAYAGRKTLNQPDDSSQLHELVSSLLYEGVAQNTTGNVFVPKESITRRLIFMLEFFERRYVKFILNL